MVKLQTDKENIDESVKKFLKLIDNEYEVRNKVNTYINYGAILAKDKINTIDSLSNNSKAIVTNIDGSWGKGKTYFAFKVIEKIKDESIYVDLSLLTTFVSVEEGIAHLMSSIEVDFEKSKGKKLWENRNKIIWDTLKNLLKTKTYIDISSLNNTKLEDMENTIDISKSLKRYIFIDNIERVSPEKRLSLIQVIEALSFFKNLIFVIISNKKELKVGLYEEGKNTEKFIDKFINSFIFEIEPSVQELLMDFYKPDAMSNLLSYGSFNPISIRDLINKIEIFNFSEIHDNYLASLIYPLSYVNYFSNLMDKSIKELPPEIESINIYDDTLSILVKFLRMRQSLPNNTIRPNDVWWFQRILDVDGQFFRFVKEKINDLDCYIGRSNNHDNDDKNIFYKWWFNKELLGIFSYFYQHSESFKQKYDDYIEEPISQKTPREIIERQTEFFAFVLEDYRINPKNKKNS